MTEWIQAWYLLLSQLSVRLGQPIEALAEQVNLPLASALLFGLLGSTAPCQFTTNLSALAFVSRDLGNGGWPVRTALAYILGKVLVYTVVGGLAVVVGVGLNEVTIPVVVVARKALGPLMIAIGLAFLGLFRLRGGGGFRLAERLRARLPHTGTGGAFLMGIVFSLAFCPTLFWLFFGLTIPLAFRSPLGWSFPGLFAVGTALPLLIFSALLGVGLGAAEAGFARIRSVGKILNQVAGVVFILAGINDTITYWFI